MEPIMAEHGGRTLLRGPPDDAALADDGPHEVQVVQFDSEAGLAAYLRSAERARLLPLKERAVARVRVVRRDSKPG
jgi:uncharacterized protein (DUF1330 family)